MHQEFFIESSTHYSAILYTLLENAEGLQNHLIAWLGGNVSFATAETLLKGQLPVKSVIARLSPLNAS